MIFILSSCGFDKNNAIISDISYDNNKDEYEVYVKENGKYVPFLVLQSDYQDGKTLLLRKECLPETYLVSKIVHHLPHSFVVNLFNFYKLFFINVNISYHT